VRGSRVRRKGPPHSCTSPHQAPHPLPALRLTSLLTPHLHLSSRGDILNHMVQFNASNLDATFAAVADPTRRGILELLGRRQASISELAEAFAMTLTGVKKHVRLLEDAGLVRTEKAGRVRTCSLGPRRLTDEAAWIGRYQQMLDARFDSLDNFLERTKGDE
jgi:DNA-binding transcriptional ArsR family regulator